LVQEGLVGTSWLLRFGMCMGFNLYYMDQLSSQHRAKLKAVADFLPVALDFAFQPPRLKLNPTR
jgi:hypothetical protein